MWKAAWRKPFQKKWSTAIRRSLTMGHLAQKKSKRACQNHVRWFHGLPTRIWQLVCDWWPKFFGQPPPDVMWSAETASQFWEFYRWSHGVKNSKNLQNQSNFRLQKIGQNVMWSARTASQILWFWRYQSLGELGFVWFRNDWFLLNLLIYDVVLEDRIKLPLSIFTFQVWLVFDSFCRNLKRIE